jgi:hypothetical protein
MNFQSIIGFLTSPFGIIILVGGFSTLGRIAKSAQEQQAKKHARQSMRKVQRDSLRTGSGASQSTQSTTPLQATTSKRANWDQKQQMRRDRIEQLRSQRVEQLKKLRQQRSAGQGSNQSPQPARPSRVQSPQRTISKSAATAQPVSPQARQPQATPIAQRPATRRRSRPSVIDLQRKSQPQRSNRPQESHSNAGMSKESSIETAITRGSLTNRSITSVSSIRDIFYKDIRRAMIAKEVLGQPLGLRDPGSGGI